MLFLDKTSVLSEIIEEQHSLIPLINRFGIKMGLGDRTISEICKESNINEAFFLAIINAYINEDYFPENKLLKFDIATVVAFIKKTEMYLHCYQISNLEKHLNAFMTTSPSENKQLKLIYRLFLQFKEEYTVHVEKKSIEVPASIEPLQDLKNIFIKHISGNFNENLCYAVIFSIDSLLKDLQKHNRTKVKILQPMIENLAEAGIDNWQDLLDTDAQISFDKTVPISTRELDVLKLIARGHINKEIADRLNISLNTVLSHRKNITSKLGIKTVSGLIFYCISQGHVSSDEIGL